MSHPFCGASLWASFSTCSRSSQKLGSKSTLSSKMNTSCSFSIWKTSTQTMKYSVNYDSAMNSIISRTRPLPLSQKLHQSGQTLLLHNIIPSLCATFIMLVQHQSHEFVLHMGLQNFTHLKYCYTVYTQVMYYIKGVVWFLRRQWQVSKIQQPGTYLWWNTYQMVVVPHRSFNIISIIVIINPPLQHRWSDRCLLFPRWCGDWGNSQSLQRSLASYPRVLPTRKVLNGCPTANHLILYNWFHFSTACLVWVVGEERERKSMAKW